MPRAHCRCGQELTFARGEPLRMTCPKCGANVKLKPPSSPSGSGIEADGYLRFLCPCGRRLKVRADNPPSHGQCPDCGRVVPVPLDPQTGPDPKHPETPTEDLLPTDRDRLDRWVADQRAKRNVTTAGTDPNAVVLAAAGPATVKARSPVQSTVEGAILPKTERGLRICRGCGMPLHLAAESCRHCGVVAPK